MRPRPRRPRPRARPRPTSRGAPAGSTARRRRWTPTPCEFCDASMAESNTPSTRNANASAGHEGASPIVTTASDAADARDRADPPAAEARDEHPREPARQQPADRQRGDRGARARRWSGPSPSRIAGRRGRNEAMSTPLAKNRVLTAIRADRARRGADGGVIGGPWCPSSRPASRREPALSSRRCLSSPRSRPSRATSGATCCRPAAGPARRSPARASAGPGRCATRTRHGSPTA